MSDANIPGSSSSEAPRWRQRGRDIWALGVGIVVCGQYFGWNLGLRDNGPVAMLAATLTVCLLFLAWVLMLCELAVAMPHAAGPVVYGQRAGGPWLGFLMGWSLFLECLFGSVATALATGSYVAFLINPARPDPTIMVLVGLTTVVVFFFLQAWGIREQARALMLMTCAALVGLVIFWITAGAHFSAQRVWSPPVLPPDKGWQAMLDAIPFALWWLIIIEAAALAVEDTHQPHRSIPSGLTWAVVTVTGLSVLTIVTACGALGYQEIAIKDGDDVSWPLAEVLRRALDGRLPLVLLGFSLVAIFGLIASYHGLLYGASRQVYGLGRTGFLPAFLGEKHVTRDTPVPALLACSLLTAAFVIASFWFYKVVALAVLTAGFAALVLYILSVVCLFILRVRAPRMLAGYRTPLGWLLPVCVLLLSILALLVYPRIDPRAIPLGLGMYALGGAYYGIIARRRMAPENRHEDREALMPTSLTEGRRSSWLDRLSGVALVGAGLALAWVALAGFGMVSWDRISPEWQAGLILAFLSVALAAVGATALRHTRGTPDKTADSGLHGD